MFKKAIITLILVSCIAVPVSGQVTETPTEQPRCEAPETIDENTQLCDVSLEEGDAIIVIRSDKFQAITVTDAAAIQTGGEIPRTSQQIDEGLNTIRFPVTIYNGFAGVTIDTGDVLYGVPIEEQTSLIGPPWTKSDATTSAIAGASSIALVSILIVIRTVTGKSEEPERLV